MTGQYTIDETDIYTLFGWVFKPGTLDALLQPAKRKESYNYGWRDQNGTERDVEETFLESRNLGLSVIMIAADLATFKTNYAAFQAFGAGGDYFILENIPTELSWKLLYDSVSNFQFQRLASTGQLVATFQLNLIDDFPAGFEEE